MSRRRGGNGDSRHYWDWLDFAQDDLTAAQLLCKSESCRNAAAFHCQQCIEKALKAFILFDTGEAVDGHNLTWLCRQAVKRNRDFAQWLDESAYLNRYYIQTRYPSDEPLALCEAQIQKACSMANEMYTAICSYVEEKDGQ